MKGFLRILEAITVSLILIAILPFFFFSQQETEWNNVLLQTQALDTLAALHKSGKLEEYVKNNNIEAINNETRKLLPRTVDYSIEISGIPNPIIFLGCVCSDSQIEDLENILAPLEFRYKQRDIGIRVSKMSLESIDPRTNVLFVFGYRNMTQKASLEKFLENGGTIFLFGDLTKPQAEDNFMNNTFGLRWNDALASSAAAKFFQPEDVTKVSHRIAGYYINISGRTENEVFNEFHRENRIAIDNKTIIFANQVSVVKTNSFVAKNGKGRTMWFAGYDFTRQSENVNQTNKLMKASILWASGESYKMDSFPKKPASRFLGAKYLAILDGFEPFEIELTVWRIF